PKRDAPKQVAKEKAETGTDGATAKKLQGKDAEAKRDQDKSGGAAEKKDQDKSGGAAEKKDQDKSGGAAEKKDQDKSGGAAEKKKAPENQKDQAKKGEGKKTDGSDDVLAPPPGTTITKIPKVEPKKNGIRDLQLSLFGLRPAKIKQITVNCQSD